MFKFDGNVEKKEILEALHNAIVFATRLANYDYGNLNYNIVYTENLNDQQLALASALTALVLINDYYKEFKELPELDENYSQTTTTEYESDSTNVKLENPDAEQNINFYEALLRDRLFRLSKEKAEQTWQFICGNMRAKATIITDYSKQNTFFDANKTKDFAKGSLYINDETENAAFGTNPLLIVSSRVVFKQALINAVHEKFMSLRTSEKIYSSGFGFFEVPTIIPTVVNASEGCIFADTQTPIKENMLAFLKNICEEILGKEVKSREIFYFMTQKYHLTDDEQSKDLLYRVICENTFLQLKDSNIFLPMFQSKPCSIFGFIKKTFPKDESAQKNAINTIVPTIIAQATTNLEKGDKTVNEVAYLALNGKESGIFVGEATEDWDNSLKTGQWPKNSSQQ